MKLRIYRIQRPSGVRDIALIEFGKRMERERESVCVCMCVYVSGRIGGGKHMIRDGDCQCNEQ